MQEITQNLFKKILVIVSSEFYSKDVINRSMYLASKLNANVHLLYIIEEKPLIELEWQSGLHRTYYDNKEIQQEVIDKQRQTADNIIIQEIKHRYETQNISFSYDIIKGEFSKVVSKTVEQYHHDLVIMGYERGCMVDYWIINEIDVPVWIEAGGHHESILAICSNLAPNQKVPSFSMQLAKHLNWELQLLYVIDLKDSVYVDENGKRSPKKSKHDLIFSRQLFVEDLQKKGISVHTTEGSLENETIKAARTTGAGLVIIGREQKRRGRLGLPVKNIKQKMAEKSKYSLLFIN